MHSPLSRHSLGFAALGLLAASLLTTPSSAQQGAIEDWATAFQPGYLAHRPTDRDFVQIAVGGESTTGLRADGSVVTWGANWNGEISSSPSGTGFTQVAAGRYALMALRTDGSIESWPWTHPDAPTGPGFTQVSAGYFHYLALRSDGSIEAWGSESAGEVSDAPAGTGFIEVLAADLFSAALRSDGSIVCWGVDYTGMVSNAPTGSGYVQVVAGQGFALALHSDGSISAWGANSDGILSNAPVGAGFTQLAAGRSHALALRIDGSIEGWGDDGLFGTISKTPQGTNFVFIAAGRTRSAALRSNSSGTPTCFGDASGHFCPCDQYGIPGEGCGNSDVWNGGAQLIGFGQPSVSRDSFGFYVENGKSNQTGLLLRGTQQLNSGLGLIAGDGLLCIGGQTLRSQVQGMSSFGSTTFNDFSGSPFGASSAGVGVPTTYQFWYRDPQQSCTGAGFNFSNAWTVEWSL